MRKPRAIGVVVLTLLSCLAMTGCIDAVQDGITDGVTRGFRNIISDVVEGVLRNKIDSQ